MPNVKYPKVTSVKLTARYDSKDLSRTHDGIDFLIE
jgi:hypothetical protein